MNGWVSTPLGNTGTWVSGGTPSKGEDRFWGGEIPWISAKSLNDFRIRDSEDRVTDAGSRNGTRLLPPGALLFLVRGMSLKTEFRMGIAQRELTFNQDVKGLIPRKGIDPTFLAYAVRARTDEVLDMVEEAGHGTGVLPTHRLQGLEILVPDIEEQRAIAEVLGALDDKVELNRQMNHTLEEMASALFKSWFVDFDPVVAKADGRKPFGMDAATAALFPAAFEPGDDGDHPLGWRWVSLGGITDKIGSGATPTGGASVYQAAGVSLIRSQNVYDFQFIWDGLAHIGEAHATALAGVTVLPKDVLINITGASFLRTCVVDPSVLPARVNQHVAIVRAAKGVPPHFLHLNLVRPWMKEFLAGHDAGGSRQAITKAHLEGVPILLPSKGVLGEFERRTTPWFDLIEANIRESRTLTALRDTLLPKLLSGEVRLKQAERLVEAAL